MEELRDLGDQLNRVGKKVGDGVRNLDIKVDKLMKLPDLFELENLTKTMVWAMDLDDKDLWLSIWSDDIQYAVPQHNIVIKGKKELEEFGEKSIFNREKKRFSTLMNTVIEIKGDMATGKDYFTHYGYAFNPQTGEVSEKRLVSEGMHYYKFRKDDGGWKIAKFEVYVHRLEEA
jgi:ketosteroid isomerase-like protein